MTNYFEDSYQYDYEGLKNPKIEKKLLKIQDSVDRFISKESYIQDYQLSMEGESAKKRRNY